MDDLSTYAIVLALVLAALLIAMSVASSRLWGRQEKSSLKGVIKRDWLPTGRIDFATSADPISSEKPTEFRLLVEERRIVESVAGNENLEIQWRLATLTEAKSVVTHYHKYLSEKSLINSLIDEAGARGNSDGLSEAGVRAGAATKHSTPLEPS